MATTTDFNEWLFGIDLTDYNDVYSLYHTVRDLENWGGYEIKKGRTPGQYFVTAIDSEDTLMLASPKALEAFLTTIERAHCGDTDIESWYMYLRAMEKND